MIQYSFNTRSVFDGMSLVFTPPPQPETVVEQPVGNGLFDSVSSISAGGAVVGVAAAPVTFTVRNEGQANLSGLAISKDGLSNAEFTVGNLGITSLAPGASTTFTVTFTPAAVGTRTAAIHIASNDVDENTFDIELTGSGLYGRIVTGATVGKPTWNRPVSNGATAPVTLSASATAVPYDVFSFTVAAAGTYTLTSTGTAPSGWDNYLFLYANSFNSASPLANVLIGNDDSPNVGVSGFSINLIPGTTYTAVSTGFANADSGAYSLVISGPGNVLSLIEAWRQTWFGTTSNTGNATDSADPYRTGVPNLLIFAFLGLNQTPALVKIGQLPAVQRVGGNLVCSFTNPVGVSGVTYGAQWSPTLAAASWLPVTDTGISSLHTFSVPVGSHAKMFMRLSLTTP